MEKQVTHLSLNSIKHKIEKDDQAINEQQLVLQVVDHKVFDESQQKKGIKSR
jgi:hypothetical protein